MQSETAEQVVANSPQTQSTSGGKHQARRPWLAGVIVILVVAGIVVSGILQRVRVRAAVTKETAVMAVPVVNVVSPQQTAPSHELVLPGNVEPYMTAPIYSRTSGYVKKWYVDIGARVKNGQLLAEIDTPEVDQQLQQSLSNLNTAKANSRLPRLPRTATRGC